MDPDWPDFRGEPLDPGRTWSARFDSFNQRTDAVFYLVTITEGGRESAPFMIEAGVAWPDSVQGAALVEKLREQLRRLAADGQANTDYTGPVFRSR